MIFDSFLYCKDKDKLFVQYLLFYTLILIAITFFNQLAFSVAITMFSIVIFLEPFVLFLKRAKFINSLWANAIAILVFFISLAILFLFLIPSFIKEAGAFFDFVSDFFRNKRWAGLLKDYPDIAQNISDVVIELQPKLLALISAIIDTVSKTTPQLMSYIFYASVACFYFIFYLPEFKKKVVYLFPKKTRDKAYVFFREAYIQIKRYLFALIIVSTIVGLIFAFFLTLIGSKYALLLGVWAAFTNLIPIVGVILEFIPLIILGFSLGVNGLIAIVIAVCIIHPLAFIIFLKFMKGYIRINPVVCIFLIIIFSSVLSVLGAIIAVPVAIVFRVFWNIFVNPFFESSEEKSEGCVELQ